MNAFLRRLLIVIVVLEGFCFLSGPEFSLLAGQWVVLQVDPQLSSPPRFALQDLGKVLSEKGIPFREQKAIGKSDSKNPGFTITIKKPSARNKYIWPKPESYRITKDGSSRLLVTGSDPVGLMYGIFELSERLSMSETSGVKALQEVHSVYGEPALAIRADNPFLTVEGETGISKWFYDERYWEAYFSRLARSRFNLCDIHAMYRYHQTNFPNIFPFFLKNPNLPGTSWPDENQARNLAMLKRIVDIAEAHGVHVSLMNYAVDTPNIPMGDEKTLTRQIRWAVAELLKRVPKLWMFGFRIGESGKSEDFFKKAYLAGISDSGKKNVRLYTRTWLADFRKLSQVGMAYPDHFYIEIKYNGEHLGAPYQAIQGRWGSYSYEKYLNYPRYWKIIWQIRANGTHRLFPWNDAEFVRRTVASCHLGDAVGFTLEPITAYFPQDPERTYEHPGSMRYTTERYWSWYLLWGRLAYNPETPDAVFEHAFQQRYGKEAGSRIYRTTTLASRIIPLIYRHHCLGPDHRNFAPEFETGNRIDKVKKIHDIDSFAKATVLDRESYLNCEDFVTAFLADSVNGKITPLQAAAQLDQLADSVRAGLTGISAQKSREEWNLWRTDLQALEALARYYAEKDRATVALQFFYRTRDVSQLPRAKKHVQAAIRFWKQLSAITQKQYEPILDPLRAGPAFMWRKALPELKADLQRVEKVFHQVEASSKPVFGHVPPKRLSPDREVCLSFGLRAKSPQQVELHFRIGDTPPRTVPCRSTGLWTLTGRIPKKFLEPGTVLRYWFTFRVGDRVFALPEAGGKRPFTARVTSDNRGPVIHLNESALRADRQNGRVHVEAIVRDASKVESVWLEWKPLPSGFTWQKPLVMKRLPETSVYAADAPYTFEGVMYGIMAKDRAGKTTRFPDVRFQTPYRVVPSYDRGLPADMKRPNSATLSGGVAAKRIEWPEVSKMGRPGEFYEFQGSKGGSITFPMDISVFGDYRLILAKVIHPRLGSASVWVDDQKIGRLTCGKKVGGYIPVEQEFYVPRLSVGSHRLIFRFNGTQKIAVEGFNWRRLPAKLDQFLISQSFPGYLPADQTNLYPIGTSRLKWRPARVAEKGIVRLDAQLTPHENCHAYAVTEIVCETPIRTSLRLGSNDGAVVWLNKKIIFKNTGKRAFKYNQFTIPVELKKGKNVLVLLISQAGRNWAFNVNLDTYDFRLKRPDWNGDN